MIIERADLNLIRELIMAELKDIPELAKEARELQGIVFPNDFVETLINIKQDEEDTLSCEHCGFYMRYTSWENYFQEQWFKCPHCTHRHLRGELNEWRYHPLVLLGYLLRVCEESKWELGIAAVRQAIDVFDKADKKLHKITEEIGKTILEGGELTGE